MTTPWIFHEALCLRLQIATSRFAEHSAGSLHDLCKLCAFSGGMPSENAQSLHKSCRDPAECSANLEVAICNLKHSASWKIQGVVILNEVRDLHFAARLTRSE